ncbi:MAG TPA: glycosyltransferase [Pyrinomonadaceae bacterium]
MKKQLRHRLPPSVRLFARRLIVRAVGRSVRLIADLLNIATSNGLDLRRELPWDIKASLVKANLFPAPPQVAAETPRPNGEAAPGVLGPQDFLFLMEVMSGLKDAPAEAARPVRASIIIPVFGQLSYTFQCFRALLREVNLREDELIIVNNGSQDETEQVFSHLKGLVRLINNEENLGFVQACNQGAAAARGEHLVFLNNDTVVKPGWLERLVETAEKDSSIGAVGSMLVYPDGRLQEAGGIVWVDGNGWNYGRGKDPDESQFRYAREVDYCSASSLLVRKRLFDELGGFDERYAPAYYEDTDLCFGIRSLGYKVVYQPLSRVIHYEGVTAGTDIQSGLKRHQELNRSSFVEKWREVLRHEHLENDPQQVGVAADRRGGPRVIVFDHEVPTPDKDSGSVRMSLILKSLAKWGRPVFVPLYRSGAREYEELLEKDGIRVASLAEYKDLIREGGFYAAILSRASVADAVLPAIRKIDPTVKIIFDTVDVHHLRLAREYELTRDIRYAEEAALLKRLETRAAASSDQVWFVTPDDAEALRREVPAVSAKVIPNIHPLQGRGEGFDAREGLLFIANFNHRPNTDAVHYFVHKVFPLVRESLPGVKFYVVGSHMPEEIKWYGSNEEGVETLGYVPDVDPLFHKSRVFVAPLRYGSGMKGKIGQALAYGLPVVTTGVGAEGMGLGHGRESMIAGEHGEFARRVVELYRDRELWQQLADNGYRHVAQRFAPQVVEKSIHAALSELARGKRPVRRAVSGSVAAPAESLQGT